ncbi:RNI-like protein [Gautieria morchelliformis]|nr:RNI-like protein [Gautieria morchelliformis]
MDSQLPDVGARIDYASHRGTVRFVGPVEGTNGPWLGVEWDDPQRGRHSGSKDGRQYFTCTIPNSASFIRPNASPIRLGCSFLEALTSKYVEAPLETSINERVVLGSSNGAIAVEAVGMDKVRSKLARLERLREVSLDTENVARADSPGQIRRRCPNLKGVDLSRSLVPSWAELARIIEELPLLETLSLNFNRLQLPAPDDLGTAFAHVRDLRLNGTLTTWDDMLRLLPSFPELLRLELGLNDIPALSPDLPRHITMMATKLSDINLQENRLQHWQNTMEGISPFKRLERLILSENKIDGIPPPPAPGSQLQHIKHLALASNNICAWADIDALSSWFPNLQTLNINSNPHRHVMSGTSARPLVIARVATLSSLNASAISPGERRDSELFYLSFIAKSSAGSEEARAQEHPRYRELCERYGRPAERREVAPDTLKSRLIETHFFELTHSSSPAPDFSLSTPPRFTLRLLPSMSLRVLRLKVLKTLKLSPQAKLQMWLALERGTAREFAEMDVVELGDKPVEWWGADANSKIVYRVQ